MEVRKSENISIVQNFKNLNNNSYTIPNKYRKQIFFRQSTTADTNSTYTPEHKDVDDLLQDRLEILNIAKKCNIESKKISKPLLIPKDKVILMSNKPKQTTKNIKKEQNCDDSFVTARYAEDVDSPSKNFSLHIFESEIPTLERHSKVTEKANEQFNTERSIIKSFVESEKNNMKKIIAENKKLVIQNEEIKKNNETSLIKLRAEHVILKAKYINLRANSGKLKLEYDKKVNELENQLVKMKLQYAEAMNKIFELENTK